MSKPNSTVPVRLLFADDGEFHTEIIRVPTAQLAEYGRLIDLLREDSEITGRIYIDLKRLVSAYVDEE